MQQQRKISRNHVPTIILFPVETFISPTPLPRSTLRGSARVAGFIEPIQHLPSPSHLRLTISLSLASRSFSMPYLACRHSDSDIVHKKAGRHHMLTERAAIHIARCSNRECQLKAECSESPLSIFLHQAQAEAYSLRLLLCGVLSPPPTQVCLLHRLNPLAVWLRDRNAYRVFESFRG